MHYIMTDKDKLYYSMFYAIIGDIIGFGNGFTEFNFSENMIVKSSFDAKKKVVISL